MARIESNDAVNGKPSPFEAKFARMDGEGSSSSEHYEHYEHFERNLKSRNNDNLAANWRMDDTALSQEMSPLYLRRAQDFRSLLDDWQWAKLFLKYLKEEKADYLANFWYMCKGLRSKKDQTVGYRYRATKAIYKNYIKSNVIPLSPKTKAAITNTIETLNLENFDSIEDGFIFEDAQNEIVEQLRAGLYPKFLNSDIYLRYIAKQPKQTHMKKDKFMHQPYIPRPAMHAESLKVSPMFPEIFAATLTEKLEKVAKERRESLRNSSNSQTVDQERQVRSIPPIFQDVITTDDNSDQSILDDHISRVWNSTYSSKSTHSLQSGSSHSKNKKFHCSSNIMSSRGLGVGQSCANISNSVTTSNSTGSFGGGRAAMPFQNAKYPYRYSVQPNQPLAQDSSMPILPQPDTTTQILEAMRRLEAGTKMRHKSNDGRNTPQIKKHTQGTNNIPSNLSHMSSASNSPHDHFTIIGYRFANETVPYRLKCKGQNITFRQFKDHLPIKKHNFRYFFKKESNEFGTCHIMEEIYEDNEVLPFVDGKIFAVIQTSNED